MEKSVLLVTDNPILSELLSIQLAQRGFSISGYTNQGKEGLEWMQEPTPSAVLLSQHLPDMDVCTFIEQARNNKSSKIIVLMHQPEAGVIQQLLDIGAEGLIATTIRMGELFFCLEEVLAGRRYICHTIHTLRRNKTVPGRMDIPHPSLLQLTNREQQVMFLIAQGWTNRQIGEKLFLSEHTIRNHRARIIKKLTIHGSHQLIRVAISSQAFFQEKWAHLLQTSMPALMSK